MGPQVILGLCRDNGKENGNNREYRDYIGAISGLCEEVSGLGFLALGSRALGFRA